MITRKQYDAQYWGSVFEYLILVLPLAFAITWGLDSLFSWSIAPIPGADKVYDLIGTLALLRVIQLENTHRKAWREQESAQHDLAN